MATVVNSIGILGLEGYLINVEVGIYNGLAIDLAIIIGILLESEQIYPQNFDMGEYIFLGEISLNGELKSVHGVLQMVIAANPMKAKIVKNPREYRWSAHQQIVSKDSSIVDIEKTLSYFPSLRTKVMQEYVELEF